MKPLISVVLPIYNVEKYLKKSLNTLISQTYENIEIICVNDGSQDGCLSILEEFAAKDPRILIINQENKGLMGARASGIAAAKGEYLISIDPDDYVDIRLIQKLYETAEKYNAQIAVCGFELVDEDGCRLSTVTPGYAVLERKKAIEELLCTHYAVSGLYPVWNKLYKKELFDGYEPSKNISNFGEDQYTNLKLIDKSERVAFCGDILYSYLQRENSMLKKPKISSIDDFFWLWEEKRIYIEKYELLRTRKNDILDIFFSSSFDFLIYCALTSPTKLFGYFGSKLKKDEYMNRKNSLYILKNGLSATARALTKGIRMLKRRLSV